eukprot:TRINITY_DN17946_c0_g1_i2.p1 TRINITY_DN17946_c0_g1~~TRINITY_DN17946_c0_g1_i2.p1  ORF type:complete len:531 (+),score=180.60 TRINITY_DN17946_c0_g1_i2:167-1594(+)
MLDRIGQPTPATHPHLLGAGEVTPGIALEEYKARREMFFDSLDDDTLTVIPAYNTKIMTHDIPWPFRQNSGFLFLTGCQEPGAVAVFLKQGDLREWYLFVAEKDPKKELWDGVQTGPDNAYSYFHPDAAYLTSELGGKLLEVAAKNGVPFSKTVFINTTQDKGNYDRLLDTITSSGLSNISVRKDVREFRVMDVKRAPQLELHRRSAEATAHAFHAAMVCITPGKSEADVNAIMEMAVQQQGAARLAYPPVIAGGDRGLSLHYVDNQQVLRDGDLLLVDAGAELHQHPTDVTRTWPVSGKFSKEQRQVYDAVLNIQRQLLDAIKVGVTLSQMQRLNMLLTAEELLKLRIFDSAQGADPGNWMGKAELQVVFPHAFGHFMGMDIHEEPPPQFKGYVPGMMHTIEPGVYLPHAEFVPEAYRGICVRIEDNVVIGEEGQPNVIMTSGIPKDPDEIEAVIGDGRTKSQQLGSCAWLLGL